MEQLEATIDDRHGAVDWDRDTYQEVLRIARHHLRAYANDSTMATAEVVHEAYLRLDAGRVREGDRAHFFALVARVIRHVLVDSARRRRASKRGGGEGTTTLRHVHDEVRLSMDDVLALDTALRQLHALNPRLVTVVEMRYFGGFEDSEIAAALGVSTRTVERDWYKARLFLLRELSHA